MIHLAVLLLSVLGIFQQPGSATKVVEGRVIDARTHEPVIGASVRIVQSGKVKSSQQTKVTGKFVITIENTDSISIHALGYYDTTFIPQSNTIEIALRPNTRLSGEVTVTASKHVSSVQDVPISTAVVRSSEIASRTPDGIDKALRYIAGVSVTEDQVNIRASSGYARALGSRVLLLLDGMPFLAADNNDIKFDALPMFNVERIEVVKGGGSALYGSSAIGGVINVITREPTTEPRYAVNVYGGYYDPPKYEEWKVNDHKSRFGALEIGGSTTMNNIGILGSFSYRRNEGYRLGDDYFRTNGFAKIVVPTEVGKLTLTELVANDNHGGWLYWRSLRQPLYPSDSEEAVNARIHSFKNNVGVQYATIVGESSNLEVKVNDLYTKFTTDPVAKGYPDGSHSSANSVNADAAFTSPLSDNLLSTSGLFAGYQSVSSDLFKDHHGTLLALYEQLELSLLKQWTVTGGVRGDLIRYDDLKSEYQLSPKFGIAYHPIEELSLRGSLGSGFRAPSIGERFVESVLSGFVVKPNTELKAERSFSTELGGSYSLNWLSFDGAVFYSTFSDLIEPTFVTDLKGAYIQFRNVTQARLYGHEEVLDITPFENDLAKVRVGYTYAVGEDLDTKAILKFRPRHLFMSRIEFNPSPFEASADFRYLSQYETYDTTLANIVRDGAARTDAYVLDARIAYNLESILKVPVKLSLQVANLLNYYYVEIVGNLAPLRNYTLRLETRL